MIQEQRKPKPETLEKLVALLKGEAEPANPLLGRLVQDLRSRQAERQSAGSEHAHLKQRAAQLETRLLELNGSIQYIEGMVFEQLEAEEPPQE